MVVKVKESFEKTRHVKNNGKSKKDIFRGQRNLRYYDRILSNKKEILEVFLKEQFHFHLFVLSEK